MHRQFIANCFFSYLLQYQEYCMALMVTGLPAEEQAGFLDSTNSVCGPKTSALLAGSLCSPAVERLLDETQERGELW
jgi:hypothetical protein